MPSMIPRLYYPSIRLSPFWVLIAVVLLLTACEGTILKDRSAGDRQLEPKVIAEEEGFLLQPASFDALAGFSSDPLQEAYPALIQSCQRFIKSGDDSHPVSGRGAFGGTVGDWRAPCESLKTVSSHDRQALEKWLRSYFRVWSVHYRKDDSLTDQGFFTGYYEASLRGALKEGGPYRYPLYGKPVDMVTVSLQAFDPSLEQKSLVGRVEGGHLKPYYDRKAIEEGALAETSEPILWSDDPVDVFFLHIQGSGQVELPSGERIRVGYAANNGRPFYAIGRALINEGRITRQQASMQSIRDWLRQNPGDAKALMQRNERYIFFRRIEDDGPIGALSVPLTPARSLAVDPAYIPLGVPLWLETSYPASAGKSWNPLNRLVVAQDTGHAIKGPVRGDFFWGAGEEALAIAGGMKQEGRYFLLLPKTVEP